MRDPRSGQNRPANMSQLDYLWTTYGSYTVSSSLDIEDSIPTSQAVKDIIEKQVSGVVQLDKAELEKKIKIIGKTRDGEEITSIEIDKDTKVTKFQRHEINQEDLDNGFGNTLGEDWLILETTDGSIFPILLEDLVIKGQETTTILTNAKDGKVAASLKVNNPITDKSVDIKTSSDGIWADLIVNQTSNSGVSLIKSQEGVYIKFAWEGTDTPIKFKAFNTYDEYLLASIDSGTIYFIKDSKSIYFDNVKYGGSGGGELDPTEYYTRSETDSLLKVIRQDVDNTKLSLDNKVDWDATKTSIILPEGGKIIGTTTGGEEIILAQTTPSGNTDLGSDKFITTINSSDRPSVQLPGQAEEKIAYLSDLTTYSWNDVGNSEAKMTLADIPTELPNPKTLTIKYSNQSVVYNGADEANIDLSDISKDVNKIKEDVEYELSTKQSKLVSGVNIKTLNGKSILGNGDLLISTDFAAIKYKGSVATYSDLPLSPNSGDVYNIVRSGVNYAWNGEEWGPYGSITPLGVDLYKNNSGDITGGEIRFSDNSVLPINIIIK